MHYRNGREAKNGDRVVQLSCDGNRILGVGILYDAVAGNDYCNGGIASLPHQGACLADCIHADDISTVLTKEGWGKRIANG